MTYIRKKNAIAKCNYCQKTFETYQHEINRGKSKYCSYACRTAFRNKQNAISPQQIFFKKISHEPHPNGCWIYTKGNRYAKLDVDGKTILAHRYSYELHYGKILDGKIVCHTCDIKLCVNPKHLFIGTQKDNIQDMLKKGRGNYAKGSNHCHSKLTEKQVSIIKRLLNKGHSIKSLSEKYKVNYSLIAQIRQRKSWKHIDPEE